MTRKITPARLDEIEAVALAAMDSTRSLGKWTAVHDCVDDFQPGQVAQAQGSPRVAQHIAMMDPATTLALVAEVRELRAKVERATTIARRFDKRDPMWRDMHYAAKVMRALEEEA